MYYGIYGICQRQIPNNDHRERGDHLITLKISYFKWRSGPFSENSVQYKKDNYKDLLCWEKNPPKKYIRWKIYDFTPSDWRLYKKIPLWYHLIYHIINLQYQECLLFNLNLCEKNDTFSFTTVCTIVDDVLNFKNYSIHVYITDDAFRKLPTFCCFCCWTY